MVDAMNIVLICIDVLAFLLSLIGNTSVIIVLSQFKYLRDIDTYIHLCLAATGLIFCNVCGLQWIIYWSDASLDIDQLCSICPFVNVANSLILAFLLCWRAYRFLRIGVSHTSKPAIVTVIFLILLTGTCGVSIHYLGLMKCKDQSEPQSTKWFPFVILKEGIVIGAFFLSQSLQFNRLYSSYNQLTMGQKSIGLFLRREKQTIIGSTVLMVIFTIPRFIVLIIYCVSIRANQVPARLFFFLRNFNLLPPALYPFVLVLMTKQFRRAFVDLLRCRCKKSPKVFVTNFTPKPIPTVALEIGDEWIVNPDLV
ncbi:hypothetical protein SNE40_001443 [Patella caerulea]|uniref:G-protein coupled receptors family 1 profile domain-containing protein n=1 Tax=Patella caerulea TaxID=87958 RepID=A0AAN8QB58_PATCE